MNCIQTWECTLVQSKTKQKKESSGAITKTQPNNKTTLR